MSLLEVKNLGISFGGLRAVDGFHISIEKGQLYGLIGPNGAGKTTVFNMLTGVYTPNDGSITLDGVDITGKKTIDINKAGIARTFQNIRLFKDQSVLDNVKIGLHNQITYSTLTGILRLPKYHQAEKEMNEKAKDLKFEEAGKIKEEIDLFLSIVRKQKYLLNLNRDIVFWINMKNYKYKVYYISCAKIKYEKVIDARYPSQIESLKASIQNLIIQQKQEKDALRKDEIDYINIINEYLKDTKDRGYIEIRKGE